MKQLKIIKIFLLILVLIKSTKCVPSHKWYKDGDFGPFFIETEYKVNCKKKIFN